MTYIVCAHRKWNIDYFNEKFIHSGFVLISNRKDMNEDILCKINPSAIFFIDWSWIVSDDIVNKYRCIGFHSAPLPHFRGGSPIQNQIIRGFKKTKISAFLMDGGVDTGDIILQRDLDLNGSLKEIFGRSSVIIFDMIKDIISGKTTQKKQQGAGSYYPRRKPEQSKIDFGRDLEYLYNLIRMLEDPYPNAFFDIENKRLLFKQADYDGNKIIATVEIKNVK